MSAYFRSEYCKKNPHQLHELPNEVPIERLCIVMHRLPWQRQLVPYWTRRNREKEPLR